MYYSKLADLIKTIYNKNPNFPFQKTAYAVNRWMVGTHDRYRNLRLYHKFKPINSTKPLECNPAAQTEIHTLTCHYHVFMYITAVKSLLRFISDVSVVVHDDGSLTTQDIDTIAHHIKGIKIIKRCDADKMVGELLAPFPQITAYRGKITNSLELTDNILLAAKDKIIITNSDILFLRRPDELIQWIASNSRYVLCVYEQGPAQQAEFLARMKSSFPPHLTLALVCLHKSLVDPAEIEKVLNRVEETDKVWYIGQNSLPAVIGKKMDNTKIKFLDKTFYEASGVFKTENVIFRHYWTSVASLTSKYFADGAQVIAELSEERHAKVQS